MLYLHMFLGAWARCNRGSADEKLSCIFTCCSKTAWGMFLAVFFVLTPLILGMFIYSARAVPEMARVAGSVMAICLIYLIFQMFWLDLKLSWWIKGSVICVFLVCLFGLGAVVWDRLPLVQTLPLEVSGANLSGAVFNEKVCFRGARGVGTNFEGTVFSGADLTGLRAPSANFKRANLAHADLTKADLGTADLSGAMLNNAKFIDAKLANTNFTKTMLVEADFTATMAGTPRDESTTDSAVFFRADLSKAKLRRSFYQCIFAEVSFRGADFSGAELKDAVFLDCDLTKAKILPSEDQLKRACGDKKTIDHFNPQQRHLLNKCEEDKLRAVMRILDNIIEASPEVKSIE